MWLYTLVHIRSIYGTCNYTVHLGLFSRFTNNYFFFSLEIPLFLPSDGNIIKTQAFTATPTKQASQYLIDDTCYSPHTEGKVQTKINYSPSDFLF